MSAAFSQSTAKRPRTVKIAFVEAPVASGMAREAAKDRRIAELEANNAHLSPEPIALRKRPRLPEGGRRRSSMRTSSLSGRSGCASETGQRVRADLQAPTPRPVPRDLPPDPGFSGRLRSPFRWAPSGSPGTPSRVLSQVALPITVTVIEDGVEDGAHGGEGAFSGLHVLTCDHAAPQLHQDRIQRLLPVHVLERDHAAAHRINIGENAFSGCVSLTVITLPPTLTEIGRHAFSKCTSLSEITLPPNLTDIKDCAFSQCRH